MNIKSLQKWMKDECISEHSYELGNKKYAFQGFGLRLEDEKFIWYYTERGKIEDIVGFANEADACDYAFEHIKNNKTAKSHLVGCLECENLKDKFCLELKQRNIEYKTDKIPYKAGIFKYRIFVFGCEWKQVEDLKTKYETLASEIQ